MEKVNTDKDASSDRPILEYFPHAHGRPRDGYCIQSK